MNLLEEIKKGCLKRRKKLTERNKIYKECSELVHILAAAKTVVP
jgi:hypothetical protein